MNDYVDDAPPLVPQLRNGKTAPLTEQESTVIELRRPVPVSAPEEEAKPARSGGTIIKREDGASAIKLKQTDAWAWQVVGNSELTASDLRLAMAILLHLNRKSGKAWPSVAALSAATRMHRRTVFRAEKHLHKLGHLAIEHGGGRHIVNQYRLCLRDGKGGSYATISPEETVAEMVAAPSRKGGSPVPKRWQPPPETVAALPPGTSERTSEREPHNNALRKARVIMDEIPDSQIQESRKKGRGEEGKPLDRHRIIQAQIVVFGKSYTWKETPSAVLEFFAFTHELDPTAPRQPRDLSRLKDWELRGWDATFCMHTVFGALMTGLWNGDPIRSLDYCEKKIEAHYREKEKLRAERKSTYQVSQ
jgi:Helix-turn-helix domain